MRRRCRTPGCEHFTREGLRGSSFHLADGEYCWRCRREQNKPGFIDACFFTVGQHDIPDLPLTPEQMEAALDEAWGPAGTAARNRFRAELAMSDEDFARVRGL